MKQNSKKILILLTGLWLLCLLCTPTTRAQTPTESPPDSLPARQYKWEVATDLLWLLDKNTVPATSVFFRRHTQKGAWRLRVGVDFSHDMVQFPETTGTSLNDQDSKNLTLFLQIGYQWNKPITPKRNFYFGSDLFFKRGRIFANNFVPIGLLEKHVIHIKNYQAGGNAFLGLQQYFGKQFSISGEMTFSAYYDYLNYKREQFEYPVDDPNSSGGLHRIDRKFAFRFFPLYTFNVSYHF